MSRGQLIGAYLFCAVFILIGLGVVFYSTQMHRVEAILSQRGRHVIGTVRDRQTQDDSTPSDRTNSITYTLDVGYSSGSRSFYHSFECTSSAFESHPFGSSVEVVYDPQDPDTARLGGNLNENSSTKMLLGGLAFTVIGIVMAAFFFFGSRSQGQGDAPDLDEALAEARRT